MKALILVGGYGTRLRPLTFSVPKPVVPFCNLEIVVHQISALAKAGVDEVILAVNYQPHVMEAKLAPFEESLGVKITYSLETEPLGTAGPLALARSILTQTTDPFFVLNSDVTCVYPFKALLERHTASGAEATIVVTRVSDPSKYGVVVFNEETGLVDRFVEKPQEFVGDCINAGIYCLSPQILERIEPKPTSIEREIFPRVAKDQKLFALRLQGYWMDIGQPRDFVTGTRLHLDALSLSGTLHPSNGTTIRGNVLIDPDAEIHPDAVIGPNVVIGKGCVVEAGVRLINCTLLPGAKVQSYALVDTAILGWNSVVQRWARLEGLCVLGTDVVVKEQVHLSGVMVCPQKSVGSSMPQGGIIM